MTIDFITRDFIFGIIAGATAASIAIVMLRNKMNGTNAQAVANQRERDSLYAENEKLSRRNKEAERQNEDLLAELSKVRRQAKNSAANHDELEDDLDKVKRELKYMRLQNEELVRKKNDYKAAYQAKEAEVALLKQKLG